MAAKRTADLIPFCHPLHLTKCSIDVAMSEDMQHTVRIEATVEAEDRTGVEMEALSAASVAALAVYDMCKSVAGPHGLEILRTRLISKTGGKADYKAL